LRSHRDLALLSFWLSSGARATELLGLHHGGDIEVAASGALDVLDRGMRPGGDRRRGATVGP